MFDKLRKRSIVKSLFFVLFFAALGIGLMWLEFSNLRSLLHGHVQFESLAPEEINEHLIVDASLYANFGGFLEEYEENTETHVTRTTDLYYVIWTGDEDDEDFRYMAIKVPVEDENVMEKMAEDTYYYGYSDVVEFSGAINKMDDEEYGYFKEYFMESGFTEEEFEQWTLPYYIQDGALIGGAAITVYVFFGIGVALLVMAIWSLISALTGKKLKALRKELEASGISEGEVEYDYEAARSFEKKDDIKIGRKLTYYIGGSKPHAILNRKIVWAYERTITHRRNGIKTGTTYEVVVGTFEKKTIHISVSKEAVALEILQYINENMPWVIIGYSDELNKMYNKNFQDFLELRYNKESDHYDM